MGASLAEQMRPDAWLCRGRRGRRDGGQGGCLLPQGACPAGMHPPFSFPSCGKENGPCTVQKKRPLLVATLHVRAKLLYGGRRIGACSDFAWPSGTLGSSASLQLPSRGGWCRPRRGARTHLTSFSFRAFRFATRSPGGRGSLYRRADEGIRPYGRTMAFRVPVGADALIGPLQKPHQPPASGSEKRSRSMRRPPRQGRHHPSRDGSWGNRRRPKRARRPGQIGACTDTPTPVARRATAPERAQAPFSLPPGAAHSLFGQDQKENGGRIPHGQCPLREQEPSCRLPAARLTGRLTPRPARRAPG